jgi:DNA-binding NtrC family response regulator
MKILVVDDETDLVDELCGFLRRRGHDAVGADGVPSACTALGHEGRFDVVLTDMRMPTGSGVDVVRACKSLSAPRPAVFVMTGQASQDDIDAALGEGALNVFHKPLSLRRLSEALVTAGPQSPEPVAA